MTTWEKVARTRRESGWIGLVSAAADSLAERTRHVVRDRVRPLLPTLGYPVLNDVSVARPRKLLDPIFPVAWVPTPLADDPAYEATLVSGLKQNIREGDNVVIVGGGLGVTAVRAARAAGEAGNVVCYEGVGWRTAEIARTLRLNHVDASVRVEHAVVGPEVALWGESDEARHLRAEDLPRCDLLEMDCEGSELSILDHLTIRPRVILVETHGVYGAPTAAVRQRLERLGYDVEDAGVAETSSESQCQANDVHVLIARRTMA